MARPLLEGAIIGALRVGTEGFEEGCEDKKKLTLTRSAGISQLKTKIVKSVCPKTLLLLCLCNLLLQPLARPQLISHVYQHGTAPQPPRSAPVSL